MAITVQEASSSNSSKWNFHVFLCFRGEDTRKSFTDHLYNALCSKGIKAFRDDEDLKRGEVISQELLQAIEGSLFAIVVLSKDYASSSWCLDELEKIIASRKELGQQVFPIFYGVDPSDVRHQRGSFAQAFIRHAKKFKEDPEKLHKWRNSLIEVANLSGWDSKDWYEVKLIEKVVETLWSKLQPKLPPYDAELVGIDSKINAIDSLLGIGSDIQFVGIWGMGGVGKTTLARVVFERLFDKFEIRCFLSNVREISKREDGHVRLQRKILSHLKVKGMIIEDAFEGKKTIQNFCRNRKVLLVLDDVSSIYQLENLAESHKWFGGGSRVIITTRNFQLLKSHGVDDIYKVRILNEEESLQLFSKRAFRRDQPEEGYLALSKSVIKYAGGLPLALRVLGSTLCGRSIPQWEDALDMLKQDPNTDIHNILRISYDGLSDLEKTIFLDIACFFESQVRKDEVTQILKSCGFRPFCISLLVEKSLLSETLVGDCTYIDMHDLIQEMGKSIVFQESPNDLGKRSRLWSPKDIDKVLTKNLGTEMTQGIVLPFNSCEAYCNHETFSRMTNLRLLMIRSNLNLPHGFKCLSSALRVLQWNSYPLEDLPLGTQLNELAYLQMRHSKIKRLWDGKQCFENLKFMDLSDSNYLFKIPNLVGFPNLESLILSRCTQLKKLPEFGENMKNLKKLELQETAIAKLPESLGFLTSLEVLNLRSCKNLIFLPHTISNLKHLKILDISGCSKFSKLPENLNENEALEELDASGTAITEIPSSIGQLEKLKTLSLRQCKGTTSNTSWILPLPLSKIFQRHQFPKGLILPPSICNLKSLTELDVSYCNINEGLIPNDLSGLSSLGRLNLSGNKFENLHASIFNLESLWELNLSHCNIGFVLGDFSGISSLEILSLEGNNFFNLPADCFSNLLDLCQLHLDSCPRLQSLPNLPPNLITLEAYECPSMEPLSDQQLLHLFASSCLDDHGLLWLQMSGDKIPSFFKNKNNITLDAHGEYSELIPVPPGERLGYVWCVMIHAKQNDSRRPGGLRILDEFTWSCREDLDHNFADIHFGSAYKDGISIMFRPYNIATHEQYSQIFFEFGPSDGFVKKADSITYGWRFFGKEDLEELTRTMSRSHLSMLEEDKDGENGMCCEAKKLGQCNLSLGESSKTTIDTCEPWTQVLTDDARTESNGEHERILDLNFKRKADPTLCKSDQDTELSLSFGPPNKKSKGKEPSH